MSGYEVEHDIKATAPQTAPPRRPDLSTFFSTLDLVDTSGSRRPQNEHSIPHPSDVSAAYRTLAHAFEMMQGGNTSATNTSNTTPDTHNELLTTLVTSLMASASDPPREVTGVSDDFLASLERIPKTKLRQDDTCPICSNAFLDDKYPLVVRLPCHKDHVFDLECIAPWLKLNPTCPLDRQKLVKEKEVVKEKKGQEDEEEGEWDDMYA